MQKHCADFDISDRQRSGVNIKTLTNKVPFPEFVSSLFSFNLNSAMISVLLTFLLKVILLCYSEINLFRIAQPKAWE